MTVWNLILSKFYTKVHSHSPISILHMISWRKLPCTFGFTLIYVRIGILSQFLSQFRHRYDHITWTNWSFWTYSHALIAVVYFWHLIWKCNHSPWNMWTIQEIAKEQHTVLPPKLLATTISKANTWVKGKLARKLAQEEHLAELDE